MKHLKLFFALFAMLALGVGNAWGAGTWTLVKDASTLSAGDKVIIVAKDNDFAMSTTQNTNNRGQVAVTKDGETLTYTTDVQELTLEDGKTSGTHAFYTGSGYLYAASSSKNYLKTETTLSANSSWNITIANTGVATIKATGSNTRNLLRYNSSNNPPIFSCYSSGQADVCLYKYVEEQSGGDAETVELPVFSATEANFTEAFNLTITSAEGTTLKYTTDKTDPTTSATAVVVENNTATVAIPAKSTMVKAIAVKGELVSNVKSMTFCYINSEATAYTVTEALAIYNEGLGLSNKLYIKGSVKSIEELNTEYGNATYTITDEESDLYIYRGKNFGGEKFTSADQLFVNDDLVLYGQLTSYNGNPQVAANSEIISRESKTKSILAEDLTFDAIALGDEVEAQTLTVTGANLTADIAATLDNEKFTVTPATLPAAGGDLTITPAADLTVGEHTATLTLTSGETTKEVALSILVKDVYTITWSVNGETSTTTVVEGDKLVLPAAPETPEACSEKVFVGWTAAEEVNADGSDITWVTATTVPTDDATYYAVFALQEGEGSLEEGNVTMKYAGSETTNMAEGNNAEKVGLDANVWNVTANKGGHNNYPGLNKDGTIRLYRGDAGTNSIIVSNEAVTIQSVTITCGTLNNVKVLVNGNEVIASNGSYAINASSFVVTNGNTSGTTQVHIASIVINYTSGASATYTDYSTTCVAPVVPETITWELNGGELVVEVPTQEELWASFKTAAGLTTLGTLVEITEAGAGKPHNDPDNPCACRIICAKLVDANVNAVFALPEWAWLKAYIMTVQSGLPEASSSPWRYAIAAFFLQSQHSAYPASADFTEAGKPENWGPAYQAAHEVVLPTEPVAEDYVLPTPVKEGYTFVGWYDNAEGTGEAYTVIPAGWAGTLYAIWKQGTTTALENIAVEGKAVKAIVNGQLIIIKNGVQYNAQGQVVK